MDSIGIHLQQLAIGFVPFMAAVIFHEFAHGLSALRWGDPTAKKAGRLTLNPIPHIDPIGTVVFPILIMITGAPVLFGWAKPVPINPTRFKKYRPGLFWVSFAGPLMNFFLGALSALILAAMVRFMPQDFYLFIPFTEMAKFSILINFALGVFNLIPLPPLDGSKMIQSFLSLHATLKYEQLARYSFFILLALIFSGALRILSVPIEFFYEVSVTAAGWIFGLVGSTG